MEERKMNEAESLALITKMIQNTQRRLTVNAGKPYLIWGYITVAISLFEWFVAHSGWSLYWLFAWWLIPLLGFPLMLITCRKKPTEPRNYVDRAVESVWIACSVALIPAFAVARFYPVSILPLVTLIISIGTFISGRLIAMKPVMWGGIFFMVGTVAMSLHQLWIHHVAASGNDGCSIFLYRGEMPIFAVLFLVGMIIPGHILNAKGKEHA